MSMKAPAFSLDYFPSKDVAWSLFQPIPPSINAPNFRGQKPGFSLELRDDRLSTYGSMGSSNGPWSSDAFPSGSVTPYSGTSPPKSSRPSTHRSSAAVSYSASPELYQNIRRANTNLTSALASLSRPFTITAAASSPPTRDKLRAAEADLSTSAPTSGVTWAANTFSNNSGQTSPGLRYKGAKRGSIPNLFEQWDNDEASDDDHDRPVDRDDSAHTPSRPPSEAGINASIRVTLKNQDRFDDEGHASVPLLISLRRARFAAYRAMYADQLTVWGLPVARSEILKFNGLTSYWPDEEIVSNIDRVSEQLPCSICLVEA